MPVLMPKKTGRPAVLGFARTWLLLSALLFGDGLGTPVGSSCQGLGAAGALDTPQYVAKNFTRSMIYHSPQKPGYTSWVGAWTMPDNDLMICFTQATGPVKSRPTAPAAVIKKLGMPDRGWDFTGLVRRQIYLRSSDHGRHWSKVSDTKFGGVGASAYGGGATLALPNGVIFRRINGWDLMGQPGIPGTAYLERSDDGARTWGKPRVLLDPAKMTYQISRMRRLHDGRIVVSGQLWDVPAGSSHADMDKVRPQLLVMVSSDSGNSWRRHDVVPPAYRDTAWDEWDFAELAGGDLFCVFRRGDPANRAHEVRWQGLLKRKGESWMLTQFVPSTLAHSGHPELLATREGIILYFATTGVEWTGDAGHSWHRLIAPGFPDYKSRYYPRSLQGADGTIYVFGHNGWDNRYGEFDQSINMDTFRLARSWHRPGGSLRLSRVAP
jgi:hypothetical protein